MEKDEWDAINLKEIPCPKCGKVGYLVRKGQNDSGNFVAICRKNPRKNEEDTGCKGQSVDWMVMAQVAQPATKPTPKVKNNNNNPAIGQLQTEMEELKAMMAQLLNPEKKIEPRKVVRELHTDNSAFDWDKYSLEMQDRIKDELLPVLDECPDMKIRELEKLLRDRNKYKKGFRRQIIIEVRNAWIAGAFGH